MAYSVDWVGKVISIPTSDLDLVSGTRYGLQMLDFLGEIRRLEAAFDEGLWAPQILDHTNPKLDFAGVNYAGFDGVINGYEIQVTGVATRVDLVGSNNNIVDVLIPTGVSVVPSNSAGYILVETGVSGLDPVESAQLNNINTKTDQIQSDVAQIQVDIGAINSSVATIDGNIATIQTDVGAIKIDVSAMQGDLHFIHQMERGTWEIDEQAGPSFGQMVFKDELGAEMVRFQLQDSLGQPVAINPAKRVLMP